MTNDCIHSTDLLAKLGMNGKDLFECGVHLARCYPVQEGHTIQQDRDAMWLKFLGGWRDSELQIAESLANAPAHLPPNVVPDKAVTQ